jgi:hypothetical protein
VKLPSFEETIAKTLKQGKSNYQLRFMGAGNKDVYISEEEREMHTHIIGSGGQGKSSMLVYHMIEDIKAGNGFAFLDPSWQGNTMKKVLAYCEATNFKKVIVVDPHDHNLYRRIVPLNPFTYYKGEAVAKTMAVIQALFGMKDMADYLRIERYYSALIGVLHSSGLTMNEARYFRIYGDPRFAAVQNQIIEKSADRVLSEARKHGRVEYDEDGATLKEVFKNQSSFERLFGSTINRLNPFFHETLSLMFGTPERLNWVELIKDGWVVLANLHLGGSIRQLHARLIGSAVLGEILDAYNRLGRHGDKPRYYVYVDECGQFINQQIIDFLYHKRQAGLSMILAHQVKAQFESPDAKSAVDGMTYIKVGFHQQEYKDREETAKSMYYGQVSKEAVDALANLEKQQAAIKIGKTSPKFVWIPDLPKFPDKPSTDFMRELYWTNIYQDANEILHDQKQRLYDTDTVYYQTEKTSKSQEAKLRNDTPRTSSQSSKKRATPNKKPTGKAASSTGADYKDLIQSLRKDESVDSKDDSQ